MDIRVTFKNMDKLRTAFKSAPAIMTEEMGYLIQRAAVQIEADAKRIAPVNKSPSVTGGNLRQSIHSRSTGKMSAIVEVTAAYALMVHEGTRPHIITAVNKKVLADRRAGKIFGRTVRHPGTRPQPFLQTAVDKNEGWLNSALLATTKKVIERAFV